MRYEDQCKQMVERQLKQRDITDERVLEAFLAVPRHDFVPEEMQHFAYGDSPLGIGAGQTISQPYMVAVMMQHLQLQPTDTVLEIGTGSGYQTALLAEIARQVFTIERVRTLAESARRRLRSMKYDNIRFLIGDGTRGWPEVAETIDGFDKIVVAAGAPHVPQELINQLNDPGILVIPQGDRQQQSLVVIRKENESITQTEHGLCSFVPLIGEDGWDD